MKEVLWQGTNPKNKKMCPYSIDFTCKPAPAKTLDSLESGRLILTVDLKGPDGSGLVYEVVARLVNNAREKRIGKIQNASNLIEQTEVSSNLLQDTTGRWVGELSVPTTWIEGGTRTYSRSGMWRPNSKRALFTLDITYRANVGNNCTARFTSEDAFHWVSDKKQAIV
jgi:hypothetical protein